ncbi:FKBP-type peptidyl-prolyl cis-trans isomerase [Gordonia sp. NPDC003504]
MRTVRGVLGILAVLAVLVVSGCGSDDGGSDGGGSSAPGASWKLDGTTGSVTVAASQNTSTPPTVKVTTPFAVEQTQVHVLTEGTGETVSQSTIVEVSYVGVNGRTGIQFDSSYQRGRPASFSLAQVIPGFAKAIGGQRVGSTVAVAIAPADGYTTGNADAGIDAGDTLVFALTIIDAQG